MELLHLMKELMGIALEDTSKDTPLKFYLGKAELMIKEYCRVATVPKEYEAVVVEYGIYLFKNKSNLGIVRKTEGEQSATFELGIPEHIKGSLPLPAIKVGTY